jgi:translocation protein SEC63
MVRKLPDEEQPGAKLIFADIVKAYETLTKEDKFNNWMQYGDPEGSLMRQSFAVALPSWMMEKENQIYILLFFFGLLILLPLAAISQTKD